MGGTVIRTRRRYTETCTVVPIYIQEQTVQVLWQPGATGGKAGDGDSSLQVIYRNLYGRPLFVLARQDWQIHRVGLVVVHPDRHSYLQDHAADQLVIDEAFDGEGWPGALDDG